MRDPHAVPWSECLFVSQRKQSLGHALHQHALLPVGDLHPSIWKEILRLVVWDQPGWASGDIPSLQHLRAMIKVSVVCRSFAAAARDLLASSDVLDLNPNTSDGPDLVDETGQVSFRLDTNLLQSWAGDLKCLNLESYTLPGLPALLQAARSLESLSLRCISALEAAQAEHVLLVCGQVQTVHILGCCIPGGLPAKMRQLTVWLAVVNEPNEGWDPDTVDILLFKLAWHKALRRLTLDFDTECRVIKLACPLCLPALDVSISMQYHSISLLDFSWLRRQPCSSLSFHVCICTASPTEQQELMRQLQPLPVSSLTLNFHDSQNTPRDVLRLWREPFPDVVFEHEPPTGEAGLESSSSEDDTSSDDTSSLTDDDDNSSSSSSDDDDDDSSSSTSSLSSS